MTAITETPEYKQVHDLFEAALVAAMDWFKSEKKAWDAERAGLQQRIDALEKRLLAESVPRGQASAETQD